MEKSMFIPDDGQGDMSKDLSASMDLTHLISEQHQKTITDQKQMEMTMAHGMINSKGSKHIFWF